MLYFRNFNINILNKNNSFILYSYNKNYFFKINFKKNLSILSRSCIEFSYKGIYLGLLNKEVNYFFNSFFFLKFKKIKFSGKGYRIYLKKKYYIYTKLGYSHKLFLYNFNNFFKFLGKYKAFIFFINQSVNKFIKNLINLRYINIFTQRGFRLTKQVIYKKKGKISSYR